MLLNWELLGFLNNRGEAGAGGDGDKAAGDKGQEKLLTQAQVDAIVQDRLARDRAHYADYDDLKKFKAEHEKELEAATQKELEAKKEYDKLKEGWTRKEQELMGLVSKKDAEVSDMKISSALMGEIVKQNAYAEETMALLKQQAVFDKEGNIRIKGRDANGLEVMHSIEEGLKQFLTSRPHLVKASGKAGGGTGAGGQGNGAGTGAGVGGDNLEAVNAQLSAAQSRGDYKAIKELKIKARALLASSGVKY
jgi:hypothetical protein